MDYTSEKLRKINCILSETNGLYHKLNVSLGLSDSVSDILYQIYNNNGSYPISGLCTDLAMPKQTVNSALRNLEKDGILFLEIYSGRNKRAVLTEKGQQFCKDTVACIFRMENLVFEEFTASEMDAFITLHKKYNAAINKYINDYAEEQNGREQ